MDYCKAKPRPEEEAELGNPECTREAGHDGDHWHGLFGWWHPGGLLHLWSESLVARLDAAEAVIKEHDRARAAASPPPCCCVAHVAWRKAGGGSGFPRTRGE